MTIDARYLNGLLGILELDETMRFCVFLGLCLQ